MSHCYGCSLCAAICPRQIITLCQDKEGFYQPVIEKIDECTECGLCSKVCAFINDEKLLADENIRSFASWSKEESIRKKSSSGGTGFEIARMLLEQKYNVVAVRYNAEKGHAEHYVARCIEELLPSLGSKYIQSYSYQAFKEIKKGGRFLITGTPCQIASMRRYVRMKRMEDDVILMDFFCHGIPSKLVWDKYMTELEVQIGKVTHASWRNKRSGWHDSWVMLVKGKRTSYNKKKSEGDLFYKFFLGNMCLGRACYKDCKFKYLNSAADIRIGDLWGSKYANEEKGVTGVLALTERGRMIIANCQGIESVNESVEVVTEGQMKSCIAQPYYYEILMALLRTPLKLKFIYHIVQMLRIGSILKIKLHL